MKDKKILLEWASTYGDTEEDVRACKYNADFMMEFAKYYHKKQLLLTDVVKSFYCFDESYHKIDRCKKECDPCKFKEERLC